MLVRVRCSRDNRQVNPFAAVVSLALPPRCPGCGAIVRGDHRFCAPCWSSLRFLGSSGCAACGLPLEPARGTTCGACITTPPIHAGVHAAVAYGDVARVVALGLKYGGRIGLAETAARLMHRVLPAGDVLVPVPLHRGRLWTRGFNQAALIADALGRVADVPVERRVLIRTRATSALRGHGRQARAAEVHAAFAVEARHRDRIAERRVVLVDDVFTTGATTDACTRALIDADVASVAVLCWARVLDDATAD